MNWVIVAVMAVALGFVAGARMESNARDARELKAAKAAAEKYHGLENQYADASRLLEELRAARAERVRTVTRTVERVVGRDPDRYHRACLDADGLRIANDALRNAAPSSVDDTKMPAANSP